MRAARRQIVSISARPARRPPEDVKKEKNKMTVRRRRIDQTTRKRSGISQECNLFLCKGLSPYPVS